MIKRLPHVKRLLSAALLCAVGGTMPTFADSLFVSYGVHTDDFVYPYTGFCVNEDVEDVNFAIRYTPDMLDRYAGAKIKKVYIGWAGIYQDYTPLTTVYVRKSLNGENLSETDLELQAPDGWNVAEFETPYVIEENDEVFVGFSVEMWEGVYGPCTLTYGSFPENTHFISRGDYLGEDGLPEWIDLSEPGMMEFNCPLMMILEVEVGEGDFNDKALISAMVTPSMMLADTETAGVMNVTNTGANEINAITLSYLQEGREIYSKEFELSRPIAKGDYSTISVPVYASQNGGVEVVLSKINGNPNGEDAKSNFAPIVVPKNVAEKYTRRPLVEYFASESEYRSYNYDTEIVTPCLSSYRDRISRIDWHFDDQFQLGLADDKDYALEMLVEVAKNDSSLVYVPTLMLDRDMNIGVDPSFSINFLSTPMIGVLFSPYAEKSYEYALSQPTFATLDVKTNLDGDVITVDVTGEADLTVLPEGEELMLTVVLVEDGIETDSQEMLGGSGEGSNAGHAIHNNLVRQCLTDIWGNAIKFNDGKFNESFVTYLDYDNVPENMRAVAFINRAKSNGMWERNVINSAESSNLSSAIMQIATEANSLRPEIADGCIIAKAGTSLMVFNASGARVASDNLPAGIYIVKVNAENGGAASFKIRIK